MTELKEDVLVLEVEADEPTTDEKARAGAKETIIKNISEQLDTFLSSAKKHDTIIVKVAKYPAEVKPYPLKD